MTSTATSHPTSTSGGTRTGGSGNPEPAGAKPATELPPQYVPADVEGPAYERWVASGQFSADADSDRPAYSIVIPPPNVTGSLHLGHAFQHTLMDALTRRRRMQGYEALWLPGMDHAGIATQTQVERHLADTEGVTRHELGREEFVRRVWQWKDEYGGKILGQMRRLGDGVDWDRERFTMDEGLSRAVTTIFKRLYDDGLIYRAERLVNWSPALRSAVSDIEVDHHEVDGELVSMRYGDGDASILVATTRVETMLGDTAVAVHPSDERYRHLVGTEIEHPITGRRIPIVADDYVDPEFGSGAVKITPAHDPNDFELGRRHDLPMPTIMDEGGVITGTGTRFDGMDRFEARVAVREELASQGRIVAEKRPYRHSVGHCSRTGVPIEPRLSLQWFVRTETLARAAGDAVRDGRVKIHPESMSNRYFDWIDNMHDWCVSRQLWWGHRIPVWYGPDGEVRCVGPDDEVPTGAGWSQDQDVLDTWFSSGLWPFSTLGWPDQTAALAKFYPTDVLLTGYDIIFFWVARMMMFGLYAFGDVTGTAVDPAAAVPFKHIVLTGLIRDQYGQKMSKSKGNVVDPLDWMDAYGADAVRFTLARGANPGTDVPIGEEWVQGSRNFCNKIWNATRFALLNGATVDGELPAAGELSTVDRWILSRLDAVRAEVDGYFEEFEFARVTETLYHFAWDEVCDWYLELAKPALAAGGAAADRTRRVIGEVLEELLRLLHPIVPFVTDTLWIELTGGESVGATTWPTERPDWRDQAAERVVADIQQVVTEVRRFRTDQGLKPGQKVAARLVGLDGSTLGEYDGALRQLLRLTEPGDGFAATASLPVAGVTVELDLSGAIDVAAERARLDKDLAAARKELQTNSAKLSNESFTAKAPDAVVAKVRDRVAAAEADIERITAQLAALPNSESPNSESPGSMDSAGGR